MCISIFIVTVDNVSSQQMHKIRKALRGRAVVLMGKNTMVRRALKASPTRFLTERVELANSQLILHVIGLHYRLS